MIMKKVLSSKQLEIFYGLAIFIFCLVIYSATNYGGMRAPDSEIVFRSAESFARNHTMVIEKELSSYPDFGTAPGKDGKMYPIFGPLLSVVSWPFVKVGEFVSERYPEPNFNVPVSHYAGFSLNRLIWPKKEPTYKPHVKRMVVSYVNAFVTALGVLFFWLIGRRFTNNLNVRLIVTMIYAFATLAWQYSSTYFSEPLATSMSLLSFYLLLKADEKERMQRLCFMLCSGLALGSAVLAHISFVLFVPFFLVPIVFKNGLKITGFKAAVAFSFGVSIMLSFLAMYNYSRFGNILETGRYVRPEIAYKLSYGVFVWPKEGLYHLLLGPAKGLLLFTPIILLSLVVWKGFHNKYKMLSLMIISMSVFRYLFIASRRDWSAGFCLGPRYLIVLIPFLLIPLFPYFEKLLKRYDYRKLLPLILLIILAFYQQIYFVLGEIFLYSHIVRQLLMKQKVADWYQYLQTDWRYSPLFRLHNIEMSPYLLSNMVNSYQFWTIVLLILVTLPLILALYLNKRIQGSSQETK